MIGRSYLLRSGITVTVKYRCSDIPAWGCEVIHDPRRPPLRQRGDTIAVHDSDPDMAMAVPLLPYAWIITADRMPPLEGSKSCLGVYGPRACPLAPDRIAVHPKARHFRLLTDDDEVLVEGMFVDLGGRATTGFEPQDDYGEGALGATTIEYLEDGRWQRL